MDFGRADSSPYAQVIEDLKFQMKMWFAHCEVKSYRREVNTVAHELASIGYRFVSSETLYRESDVPPQVAGCVLGDLPKHS